MLREVAASAKTLLVLRQSCHAARSRSICKNAVGVKTIAVMLREVAAYVRLVVSLRAVAWAWSQPAVQAQMRRDPTLLVLRQ